MVNIADKSFKRLRRWFPQDEYRLFTQWKDFDIRPPQTEMEEILQWKQQVEETAGKSVMDSSESHGVLAQIDSFLQAKEDALCCTFYLRVDIFYPRVSKTIQRYINNFSSIFQLGVLTFHGSHGRQNQGLGCENVRRM